MGTRGFGAWVAVTGAAFVLLGARAVVPGKADTLSWSADSRYVVASRAQASAVRLDQRGRATIVPSDGLSQVRLSPDGRLALGARDQAFVSVDLETGRVEEIPIPPLQGKPVLWVRGPVGDVIVTKTVSHYNIRRSGGRTTDADAAPTKHFRDLWVDRDDPFAYVDTGYGLEVRHLRSGLTLRGFDAGLRDQRVVGATRDPDGRLTVAVENDEGFHMWTPPDALGPAWEVDPEAPKAMSGDGLQVAVGDPYGVGIYSAADGQRRKWFKTRSSVLLVAFSPDGSHVCAALVDGSIKVWSVDQTGLDSPLARTLSEVDVGRLLPDAASAPVSVRRATEQLPLSGATVHLASMPKGKLSAWVGGRLVEIDPKTGAEAPLPVSNALLARAYAWAPDEAHLAVITDEGVDVFDIQRRRRIRRLSTGGAHNQLEWRAGVLTVDQGSGWAQSFDSTSGVALAEPFVTSDDATARFHLSPTGSWLVVTGRTPRVLHAADGKEAVALSQHWGGVLTATWSPDGARLATAGGDGTVLLWDVPGFTPTQLVEGAHGRAMAFSPDGGKLVSASWDGAYIGDAVSGELVEGLSFSGLLSGVVWHEAGIAIVDNAGSLYIWR